MFIQTTISQENRKAVARRLAKIRCMLDNPSTRQKVLEEIYIKWLK